MKPSIVLFVFALAGCAAGQGEVDVTATTVATFPGAPAAMHASAPSVAVTTDGLVTLDVQGDLASLGDIGKLSGSIVKNTLSGPDLAFIQHIKATIASEDGKMPVVLVSDVDVPQNSTEVALDLTMSDTHLLEYLTEGKVTIHFYVTGNIPERPFSVTHTMIAHMGVAVNGSVLKL